MDLIIAAALGAFAVFLVWRIVGRDRSSGTTPDGTGTPSPSTPRDPSAPERPEPE